MSRSPVSTEPNNPVDVDDLIIASQAGSTPATEELLARFRPLLRARLHELWARLREDISSLEWEDVEAQLNTFFLARLQAFRREQGVFFPHYIAQMLDLDARSWLRKQRKSSAVPFSQLETFSDAEGEDDEEQWWLRDEKQEGHCETTSQSVAVFQALEILAPHQRTVIELCCLQNQTEEAAAKTLGLSRSAIRSRLESALQKLREHLEIETEYSAPAPTRTGRAAKKCHNEFDVWSLRMTREEKRPDLVGIGAGKPILMQGIFDFPATGIKNAQLLSEKLRFIVPIGCVVGLRFFRAGVTCDKMVCLSTVVNGMTHRLIPLSPNSSAHIPFAIVEPIPAGSEIEIHIASDAPGTAIIDVGGLLMPA